jgi:hypothetical protein
MGCRKAALSSDPPEAWTARKSLEICERSRLLTLFIRQDTTERFRDRGCIGREQGRGRLTRFAAPFLISTHGTRKPDICDFDEPRG